MARKRYAVGGNLSNGINRRNYWFDENDGIVEYNNSVPEPTPDTTEEEPVVQQRTTPRRIKPNTTRIQNKPANKGIVTIGTKSFNSAFRQARIAGLDKFRWNGKVYGTKLANEVGKNTKEKARNAVKPTSQKPKNNSGTNRINGRVVTVPVTASARSYAPVRSYQDYANSNANNYQASYTRPVTLDIARAIANKKGNLNNTKNMPKASYTKPILYDIARAIASRKRNTK